MLIILEHATSLSMLWSCFRVPQRTRPNEPYSFFWNASSWILKVVKKKIENLRRRVIFFFLETTTISWVGAWTVENVFNSFQTLLGPLRREFEYNVRFLNHRTVNQTFSGWFLKTELLQQFIFSIHKIESRSFNLGKRKSEERLQNIFRWIWLIYVHGFYE